jgi:proline iminopeptidase
MAFIKHNIGQTFYKSKGSLKIKTPLICLHGGPGGMSLSLEPLFKLSTQRKVFIYDQIGGGRSSLLPKSKWKVDTFVKELDTLIEKWNLDEFHLFGASWGTTLALEYYLKGKFKSKIKSIIFQSPMFSAKRWESDANKLIKNLPKETQKIIRYCHEIDATDSKVYKKAVFNYYLRHVLRNKTKLSRKQKYKNTHGQNIYEYMWGPSEFKASGTLKHYDKVDKLKLISVPCLFICGEFDEATPSSTKYFSKLVKKSKLKIIENASHSILSERPTVMIKEIKSFLKDFKC